ncbi:MAG: TauD/TfdA family dioxygenase [Marinobacterium sp.]|nr:TauD/TfdA family dioxygenase [Marinobacterium sp.]
MKINSYTEREIPAITHSIFKKDNPVILIKGGNDSIDFFEKISVQACESFHLPATRKDKMVSSKDKHTTEVFRNNLILSGHTEGAYLPKPTPDLCFFVCITAPKQNGGETTLVNSTKMLEEMPCHLRQRFQEEGIIYEYLWQKERWQAEFNVQTIEELEIVLQKSKSTTYEIQNQSVKIQQRNDAVSKALDGSIGFSNGILAHLPAQNHPDYIGKPFYTNTSNNIYYGSGDNIDNHTINTLITLHDKLSYKHRWKTGDMLIFDNRKYLHGRTMTEKPCSRVLFSRFGYIKHQET